GRIKRAPDCSTCTVRPGSQPGGGGAIAGNPVKATPLTEADHAVNLESAQLGGDPQLQNAFDDKPPIGFGHSGPAIKKVQQALIDLGSFMPRSTKNGTAPPDGVFGTEMLQVIKGFQFRQGIQIDGILGRQTLGELDSLLTGNHVPG